MLVLRMVLALVLVLTLATPADARDETAPTPLLEAMAFVRPERDPVGVSFVDWAQLKRLYGSEALTSSSPLEDRQRFMLEVARNESLPLPLGIDRLITWPAAWGWDNTDLDWQARSFDGRTVLRFGERWDPAPFRTALESSGYQLAPGRGMQVWLPPDVDMPTDLRLERVSGEITGSETSQSFAPVTISGDGRTVVIHDFGVWASPKRLRRASRPDLERIANTPVGRAAAALGDVEVASVAASRQMPCAWPGEEGPLAANPEVSTIVAGLHPYQARAEGYRRAAADTPARIRYVFSYQRSGEAQADLEGRSSLVEMALPSGPLAAELTLIDSHVDGKEILLDVEPVGGHPGPYLGARMAWAPFAMCGDGR